MGCPFSLFLNTNRASELWLGDAAPFSKLSAQVFLVDFTFAPFLRPSAIFTRAPDLGADCRKIDALGGDGLNRIGAGEYPRWSRIGHCCSRERCPANGLPRGKRRVLDSGALQERGGFRSGAIVGRR